MNEDVIHLWIPVWGDHHLDLLERYALPSLTWPGNLLDVGVFVDAYTHEKDFPRLNQILKEYFNDSDIHINLWQGRPHTSLWALQVATRKALEFNRRLLVVMPDTIFGNGSVRNIYAYARNKFVNVAAGHLRVDKELFVKEFPCLNRPISNPELVQLAFNHAHQSSRDSWFGRDNGTAHGGISLMEINRPLFSMIHHLPTVYLAAFNDADIEFFNQAIDMGAWDHTWPATLITESVKGRLRVVGSSDMFFAIELTDEAANRIEVAPGSEQVEDYYLGFSHHALCGHFLTTLRTNG